MADPDFRDLLAALKRGQSGRIEADIPDSWMQGRTTYGGLTAALSYESARILAEDLLVRSVQVSFIGPVGGHVVISPSLLRRGKSAAFVNVDIVSEKGIVARSVFTFGAMRESGVRRAGPAFPEVARPEDCPAFFTTAQGAPAFTDHFDIRMAHGDRPFSASSRPDIGLWLHHKGSDVPESPTALLALADAPPPAALQMMPSLAPISSMTWMAEFLSAPSGDPAGWYFAHHTAEAASEGYSTQRMVMWAGDGRPVLIGRQTVAMFA